MQSAFGIDDFGANLVLTAITIIISIFFVYFVLSPLAGWVISKIAPPLIRFLTWLGFKIGILLGLPTLITLRRIDAKRKREEREANPDDPYRDLDGVFNPGAYQGTREGFGSLGSLIEKDAVRDGESEKLFKGMLSEIEARQEAIQSDPEKAFWQEAEHELDEPERPPWEDE